MLYRELFSRDQDHHLCKLVNLDHFFRADIHGTRKIRPSQSKSGLHALINKQEGPGLLPVPPNFNFISIFSFCYFAANRSW